MKGAAVGVLLLSSVTVFLGLTSASPQKSFHFVPDKRDWASARRHCTDNFEELASVSAMEDLAVMSGLVDTADQYAFVGLQRKWQWLILDKEDYRETNMGFNNFGEGEPNDEHNCGMIQPSGEWRSQTCTTFWPFFCYDENITDRFVKGDRIRNWGMSKNYCQQHHTGLARIRNQTENQRLVDLFNGTESGAWIALTKRKWSWSDGSYPGFVPWVPEKPQTEEKHCAALNVTGEPVGLVPWNCNDTLPFFCYRFPQKKLRVKISMSVPESAVDSAADSLLKLVESKLKDLGVSEDLRLSWSKRPQKVTPAAEPDEPEPRCPAKPIFT